MIHQPKFEDLEKTLGNFSEEKSQKIKELEDKYRPVLNQFNTEKLVEMSKRHKEKYTNDLGTWLFPSLGVYAGESFLIGMFNPPPGVGVTLDLASCPVIFIGSYLLHRRKRKGDENELTSEFVSTFGKDVYKERFHGKINKLVEFYTSLPLY